MLFDFEFPLRYCKKAPTLTGNLADWSDAYLLPDLCRIDGQDPFAKVWAAWNETGLFIAAQVAGRTKSLQCDPQKFWRADNVRICTDMRDNRTIKRANRYCQQFYFLPIGAGKKQRDPIAGSAPINRAVEQAPHVPAGRIRIAASVTKSSYKLEAQIPAEILSGFDPAEHPRIGFYYIIEDTQLGQQYLTVGDDLYWFVDPSTWPTAVLT